jgi:hypothetical protein
MYVWQRHVVLRGLTYFDTRAYANETCSGQFSIIELRNDNGLANPGIYGALPGIDNITVNTSWGGSSVYSTSVNSTTPLSAFQSYRIADGECVAANIADDFRRVQNHYQNKMSQQRQANLDAVYLTNANPFSFFDCFVTIEITYPDNPNYYNGTKPMENCQPPTETDFWQSAASLGGLDFSGDQINYEIYNATPVTAPDTSNWRYVIK